MRVALKTITGDPATCRSCGAPIRWMLTVRDKRMPVNEGATVHAEPGEGAWVDSSETHWATCPNGSGWRTRR